MGGRLASRLTRSFGLRMALGVSITLVVLGGIEYVRVSRDIEQRLVERSLAETEVGARHLAYAFASAYDADPMQAVGQAVDAMSVRPHLERTELVDQHRRVVAASDPSRVDERREDERISAALAGRSSSGESGEGTFEYVVPVELPPGTFALVFREQGSAIEPELADLRAGTLLSVLIGIPFGVVLMYLLAGRALTRRHRAVAEHSVRDALTGLGNHRLFQEELRRAVAGALRRGEPLALAMVDLDDFKLANDRHGHGHGDRLLVELASTLRESRAEDRAFRLGGDEFALLLPFTDLEGARTALERVRAAAGARLGGTTVSAGVAELDMDAPSPDRLLQEADAALYEAKRRGRDVVATFGEVDGGSSLVTVEKVAALRRLLDEGRMGAAFQPIWDLPAKRVIGYEALARPADDYGFAGPAEAFEIAEAIGRAHQLDHLCCRTILARGRSLASDALLFLNLSPQSLDHDLMTAEGLVALVEGGGLVPEQVVLEITEQATARRAFVVDKARELRAMGFKLALDDVGAGNAGLEMLGSLPMDYVKVDRGVVTRAVSDRSARAVLAAVLAFADQTGAYVIAEGIEDAEMLAFIRDPQLHPEMRKAGIRGAQGYLLGRPSEDLTAGDIDAYDRT